MTTIRGLRTNFPTHYKFAAYIRAKGMFRKRNFIRAATDGLLSVPFHAVLITKQHVGPTVHLNTDFQ